MANISQGHYCNSKSFTKASIALHNFLQVTELSAYWPAGFLDAEDRNGNVVEGTWREEPAAQGLEHIRHMGSNQHSQTAATIRVNSRSSERVICILASWIS